MSAAAAPTKADDPDAFDIHRQSVDVTILRQGAAERLLLRHAGRSLRFDICEGTLLDGPVRMRYLLSGYTHLEPRLLTLQRFAALRRLGHFPAGLFRPHPRRARWAMFLQTLDAMTAGASQRQIATTLFGEQIVNRDWKTGSSYLRLRVQRLTRTASELIDGGYRRILGGFE